MSMAAAFGLTIGIMRSILAFDLLRFISDPPADGGGRAGLRNSSDS
jgi:hypothetical protein